MHVSVNAVKLAIARVPTKKCEILMHLPIYDC
jgi:hypothetical protein